MLLLLLGFVCDTCINVVELGWKRQWFWFGCMLSRLTNDCMYTSWFICKFHTWSTIDISSACNIYSTKCCTSFIPMVLWRHISCDVDVCSNFQPVQRHSILSITKNWMKQKPRRRSVHCVLQLCLG